MFLRHVINKAKGDTASRLQLTWSQTFNKPITTVQPNIKRVSYRNQIMRQSAFVSPKFLAKARGVVDHVKNYLTCSLITTQNLVVASHAVGAHIKCVHEKSSPLYILS